MTSKQTGIFRWFYELDRILRGEATRPGDITQADIKIPVFGISLVVILLAVVYGFCMGIFALIRGAETSDYNQALMQTLASMCKVPMLFFLTLLVTFPSLYVFNALVGSQLRIASVLKLLIASMAVNLAVLASMGPILAFFSVSTPSYSFIVLLNVVLFAVAGVLGLSFLVQTLNRLTTAYRSQAIPAIPQPIPDSDDALQASDNAPHDGHVPDEQVTIGQDSTSTTNTMPGPLDQAAGTVVDRQVWAVFSCWIVVFGLVGAQMGWVLRPFIGSPGKPFQWFRARDSNFFEAVINAMQNLFFGG